MTFSVAANTIAIIFLAQTSLANNIGQWGPTLQFPLVPVAGFVEPNSGQLVVWAAYKVDTFQDGSGNLTQTAVYNPADGSVKEFPVAYTEHDMFCPGISMDFDGNVVVTGGDTSAATSLFHQGGWYWERKPDMVIPRGYQASTTLSDGRVFTIGGSWSGGEGNKNGEIWNGNQWTLLPGCEVAPMLTNDRQGIFRQDSHAWLFAWSNASVLQAGPSKAMNWYSMDGDGSVSSAGSRASDSDAMCGPAVMYDAVAGKILAVGGSPDYQDSDATANAHVITVGGVGSKLHVETINPMWSRRIFANSIVLPDGTVFIVGGQAYGNPFFDNDSQLTPELWLPSTRKFIQLAPGPTPRNYHSIALLMPNGTVFSGGGGLCGDCGDRNHFDGQLYSPPYLFKSDGVTPAPRPIIKAVSTTSLQVGGTFKVTLGLAKQGKVQFSLVRMGSSTHTVNTDQRRVPLQGRANGSNSYTITLPSDSGVLLPGYWYLFALAGGVPSVAQIIQVYL